MSSRLTEDKDCHLIMGRREAQGALPLPSELYGSGQFWGTVVTVFSCTPAGQITRFQWTVLNSLANFPVEKLGGSQKQSKPNQIK